MWSFLRNTRKVSLLFYEQTVYTLQGQAEKATAQLNPPLSYRERVLWSVFKSEHQLSYLATAFDAVPPADISTPLQPRHFLLLPIHFPLSSCLQPLPLLLGSPFNVRPRRISAPPDGHERSRGRSRGGRLRRLHVRAAHAP